MLTIDRIILLILFFHGYIGHYRFLVLCDKWVLKWADHFIDDEIDDSIWSISRMTLNYMCFTNNMRIVNRKLLLRVTTNDQINNSSCKIFVSSIYSNYGWTYGKFEVNASIEHNNAKAFISLLPMKYTYGREGRRSGFIAILLQENEYLRQRLNRTGVGIIYGYNLFDYHYLNNTQKSLIKSGFHVFIFEWNKRQMVWKIDENIVFIQSLDKYFDISDKDEKYAKKGQPFDHNFRITVSNEFSSDNKYDDINKNFTDSEFVIDYIKYYEWNETEEIHRTNISDSLTYFNETIIIIVSIVIIFIIICLLIYKYYKRSKRNQSLMNTSEKNETHKVPENDYDSINYDEFELYENCNQPNDAPNVYRDLVVPNNYIEITP